MKWKEGLKFVINTGSPGEVIVALRAETIGGRSDFAKTTLRLLSLDEKGRPVEDMNFTVLVARGEQGSTRLVLKYLAPKGWLLL